MGGLSLATVAKVGTVAMSLMSATQKNNTKISYLNSEQLASNRKRQNLLDQQLASRRASVGAMGLGNSKSAAAVQERMAAEAYDEMADDEISYKREYQQLQDENNRQVQQSLLNAAISAAGKIIK